KEEQDCRQLCVAPPPCEARPPPFFLHRRTPLTAHTLLLPEIRPRVPRELRSQTHLDPRMHALTTARTGTWRIPSIASPAPRPGTGNAWSQDSQDFAHLPNRAECARPVPH